jgi:DNA-binding NarL/FixJ family response regulator
MKIRILIVSDVRLLRDCIAHILGAVPEFSVAGVVADRAEGVTLSDRLRPDVIVLDRTMPESLLAAREMLAASPATRILVTGAQETEPAVQACAAAGVAGILPRDASHEDLTRAVLRLTRGELVCSGRVAELLALQTIRPNGIRASDRPLTSRETQIAQLLELGFSNKEVAARIGIEVATVKNHVHKLLRKLDAHCRGQVAGRWRRFAPDGVSTWSTRSAG